MRGFASRLEARKVDAFLILRDEMEREERDGDIAALKKPLRRSSRKGEKEFRMPPTIGVGVSSNNSDLATSLSQAGQQIAQLQSAYQQQAALITANTQAIQGNTSAQSSHSALSTAGGVASSLLGGRSRAAFAADLRDREFVRREFDAGAASDSMSPPRACRDQREC